MQSFFFFGGSVVTDRKIGRLDMAAFATKGADASLQRAGGDISNIIIMTKLNGNLASLPAEVSALGAGYLLWRPQRR